MLAIDPNATWDFVPSSEKGKDLPTTFVLRALTAREYTRAQGAGITTDDRGETFAVQRANLVFWLCKFGIAGVRNWSVPFELEKGSGKRGIVADSFIDAIPANIRQEIASEIDKRCDITEEDLKN